MTPRPIVVASNRGPVTFARDERGEVVERRGVGGLVTAVGGAIGARESWWICAAMSDEDRARAAAGRTELPWGGASVHVRFVDIDPDVYRAHYDGFANRVLWFAMHDLLGTGDLEAEHGRDWRAHQQVAATFADAIVAEAGPDAIALPQDYHLALVPAMVRRRRPALPLALFWHIPFCTVEQLAKLPHPWARDLLTGMLGADRVGFHARRWAANFRACCEAVLGASLDGEDVIFDGRRTRVAVHPLGVDPDGLARAAASSEVAAKRRALDAATGDRALILRADRTDLTKNIVRGLRAYRLLLERRPDLHERVTHAVYLSPSRGGIPEYEAYLAEVRGLAADINATFGRPGWQPLELDIANDFPRTLAGFARYDVLLVNPVFDGMNLVAREGPLLNERDGVLVLSRNAGAAEQLGDAALLIDPFDVEATADALAAALDMTPAERADHAAAVRAVAAGTSPADWLAGQIDALERDETA